MIAAGTITARCTPIGARAGLTAGTINTLDQHLQVRHRLRSTTCATATPSGRRRADLARRPAGRHRRRHRRHLHQPRQALHRFRFKQNGKTEYFDATGRPLKKVLMRIPIEFARLSSTFGMRSTRCWAACACTRAWTTPPAPARRSWPPATAGAVRRLEERLRPRRDHRPRPGPQHAVRAHVRVGQGQAGPARRQGSTIGYVGTSGLATGPHLHYEFRINGMHLNPLTVTMPKPAPLAGARAGEVPRVHGQALARIRP